MPCGSPPPTHTFVLLHAGRDGPERQHRIPMALWLSTPWLSEVLLNARMTGVQSVSSLWEGPPGPEEAWTALCEVGGRERSSQS